MHELRQHKRLQLELVAGRTHSSAPAAARNGSRITGGVRTLFARPQCAKETFSPVVKMTSFFFASDGGFET